MVHRSFRRLGLTSATTTFASTAAFALFANAAAAAPAIRTGATNQVPACVTPDRLMDFLSQRNARLDRRFLNIAKFYKIYGEGWHVRWDYAFFQMAIETNFLKFRRGDGSRGDVHETQNNFAGLGATGNGVPGERFPDVATGVHAQIQHLVAYSGERLVQPIARRTQNNQDDIIAKSHRLGRAVTFADLARRWAADRHYGKSIDLIARLYQERYCTGETQAAESTSRTATEPMRRWQGRIAQPSGLGGPMPERIADPKEGR